MREKRKEPRAETDVNLPVLDINTGRHLGQLVNLSSEGMMLICPAPIEPNHIFQVELPLEAVYRQHKSLSCGVESLWSIQTNQNDRYWAGLKIIDASLLALERIEALIEIWSARKMVDVSKTYDPLWN